jgi:hypothetical protein
MEQINFMIESLRKDVYANFVTCNTYQGMETRVEIIEDRLKVSPTTLVEQLHVIDGANSGLIGTDLQDLIQRIEKLEA